MCASEAVKSNGEIADERTRTRRGRWYRVHALTWVVAGLTTLALSLIIIPGRTNNYGAFTGVSLFQEHGWPLVFLDCALLPRDSNDLAAERDYLMSQGLGRGVRWAKYSDMWYSETESRTFWAPWTQAANWPCETALFVSYTGLIVDLVVALGIVAAVAAGSEKWCRHHWRYSLRSMLAVLIVTSLVLGRSINHRRQELRAATNLETAGGYVDNRYETPIWLSMLVGRVHLPLFRRADELGFRVENMPGRRQAMATVAENARYLSSLQAAFLSELDVTDTDLVVLEAWPDLEQLSLHHASVTDAGISSLRSLSHLKILDLNYTAITDTGLRQLETMTQLECLHVCGTKVTDAGVARLQRVLPNCAIDR